MRLLPLFFAVLKLRLAGSYIIYRARFYGFARSLGVGSNLFFAGVAVAIALPVTLLIRFAWHAI